MDIKTRSSRIPARLLGALTGACLLLPACDGEPAAEADTLDAVDGDDELEPPAIDGAEEDGGELEVSELEPEPDDDIVPDGPLELVDPADSDPALDVGAVSTWSWGTPGNSGPDLDMGPAHNRTCFLQGVTGELEGQWNGPSASVTVEIDPSDNHWKLRTRAGVGSGVMGHAACISNTFNRTFIEWHGDSEDNQFSHKAVYPPYGSRSPFTQCFLTSVTGTDGWKSPDSVVVLQRQNIWESGGMVPKWTLGGGLLWEQDNTAGGSAKAVCVDIWQELTPYTWETSPGSTGTWDVLGTTANRVCSVQFLKGNFASDPLGWDDGVRLAPAWDSWMVYSSSGKKIAGECLDNVSLGPVF